MASQGLLQFSRYGVVGVATNISLYLLFLVLVWIGTPPVLTSGMVYVLGVTLSYLLNRRFTFKSEKGHGQDLPRFVFAYGLGLVFTVISMSILVDLMSPAIAQILTTLMTAAVIYTTLLAVRFGR